MLFYVEYVLQDGRKMPEHVADLPNVCMFLYLIVV
jgi:hypothetical protein